MSVEITRSFSLSYLPGEKDPFHTHNEDQLLFTFRGVILVETNSRKYLVPPERLLWIPAGAKHELTFLTKTESKSLYFRTAPDKTQLIRVLGTTKLLKTLLESSFDLALPADVRKQIGTVILLLLKDARPISSELSMPATEIFLRTSQKMILENKWQLDADDFAQEACLHKATFLRHFQRDVGMNFRAWKCLLRLSVALAYLNSGLSVKSTALRLQYACESNFVESFKKVFGMTPGGFVRPRNDD